MKNQLFSVWEGVYENFSQAGNPSSAFSETIWIEKQRKKILEQFYDLNEKNFIPNHVPSYEYPLTVVASLLMAGNKKLSILDFGGGMGSGYLDILSKIPNAIENCNYYIIENEKLIAQLPNELKDLKNLFFVNSYANFSRENSPLILHFGSSMQYISDWKGLITNLCEELNPEYLVLSDLHAGDIPSFVTNQIFYEHKIPQWFLNYNEVVNFMFEQRYHLIYQSYFIRKILEQEECFPNFALPESMRIHRPINVIFSRGS